MADDVLTDMQRLVLVAFFALPESDGFMIAGGAALVASGLSDRPTGDVDLFGADLERGIAVAADAFEAVCASRGWTIERLRDSSTFRRVAVHRDDDEVLVDIAVDSPPNGQPVVTALGPTYPPEELAARKLLALFDRAALRDFIDLHTLSDRFDLDHLVDLAGQLDDGFEPDVLSDALGSHTRYTDDEIAAHGTDPAILRAFAEACRDRLARR